MRTSILFLAAFLSASIGAQQLVDDRTITVVTGTNVITKRQAIVDYIWGTEQFPSAKLPSSVVANIPSPITRLENLERLDLFRINETSSHSGRVLHFIPLRKNGQVVVVHQGHSSTFGGSAALIDDDPSGGGGLRG
ncbi:MAG TPA: hypothetical protein VNI54_03670 [Thermoanaerobaculia bacterium]|nr:hypothetical protein [Thermoanaerobaculia bacterium]